MRRGPKAPLPWERGWGEGRLHDDGRPVWFDKVGRREILRPVDTRRAPGYIGGAIASQLFNN